MDQYLYIIIIILSILLIYELSGLSLNTITECSNNDGNCYKISADFSSKTYQQAANELARINEYNANFITYLRNKYLWVNNSNEKMKAITLKLIENYNPDVLRENNPNNINNTSYVLEKGKVVAFCLREKESGNDNFEDPEMLIFVNLHEISHLAMSFHDPQHGDEFWETFKLIINEAIAAGMYEPKNWANNPKKYCGLRVDYNPYYDDNIIV